MSRKERRRLKALSESSRAGGTYLDPNMDDINEALASQDRPLWATKEEREAVGPKQNGTARDEADDVAIVVTKTLPPRKPQISPALVQALLAMQDIKLCPAADATFEKDITWVLAGNGIFQVRQTPLGQMAMKVKGGDVPGLPDWTPPAYRWPLPKMPWFVFAPAVAFLRWVKQTYQTEGLVRGYWDVNRRDDPDAGWTIHIPPQVVSAVSVDVANTVEDPGLGAFAMELHSHPGDSSVFSGTDDENEQRSRLFGCVAGLTAMPTPPNFHWRVGTGAELWQPIKLQDVVRCDETITFTMTPLACVTSAHAFDPFGGVEFPELWKDMVTPPSSVGRVQKWSSLTAEEAIIQEQDLLIEMRRRERTTTRFDNVSNRNFSSRRYS